MYVKERFILNDYTKDCFQDLEPPFGYNGFGEFLYYRTYSRNINGKQENWADTIIRVIEGTFSIRKDHYIKNHISWDEKYWQDYAHKMGIALFNLHWSPSGRGLWAMGTPFIYERGSMALYSCAYTEIHDDIGDDANWIMDTLMLGVGVGFSPIRNDSLVFKNPKGTYEYVIEDSREGWSQSIPALINSYKYGSSKPKFVYDEIRPKGSLIKGFGGIASGPDPLKYLHKQIEEDIELYITDKYYDIVLLKTDITNQIGCCVVAGNVRRSAENAILSINDPIFKNLKNYKLYPRRSEWGWMSNNSVKLEKDEDFEKLGEISKRVIENGEPGYINLQNIKYGRIGKNDKVRKDTATGCNPCQSYFAKVLTPNGIVNFGELEIGNIIWSQTGWTNVINKVSTGINKVYKYKTTAGIFYGTANHQVVSEHYKIEVQHATSIDILTGPKCNNNEELNLQDVIDGLVIGDGSCKNNFMLLNIGENDQDYYKEIFQFIGVQYSQDKQYKITTTIKEDELPVTYKRKIPDRFIHGSFNKICGFLRGLYSANGSLCGNRITLKATSFDVIESTQLMLSAIGIPSYFTTNKATKVEFSNGIYEYKQSYDLNITHGRNLFLKYIGFIQKYKQEILEEYINNIGKSKYFCIKPKKTYDIIEIEYLGEMETWDITVDNIFHTYWTQGLNVSNCFEIPLEGGFDKRGQRIREVCNIDETYPTICSSIEEWYKAVEYATCYCSTVSLLPTHQESTNRIVAKNRRIGVGIVDFTGWMESENVSMITKYLRKGYKVARKINKQLNAEAGIPESIRVTTFKPGGTTPKVAGKTSGAGYPNAEHMIRRVRVARNSPVHKLLIEANIPYEADYYSINTDVFEFVIKCGPAPPVEEISVWQQAFNLVLLQREWADNMVSNTLMFRPKWKLVKRFSRLEGVNNPFDSTKYWLLSNIDHHIYDELMNKFSQYQEEFCHGPWKIKQKLSAQLRADEICIYEYDPKHEEDSIEPLLAAIAPLTKSVSLLPQTAKGVYLQMPEETITKEEYETRLSRIKKIDWSRLSSSDGIDEKFCNGDTCQT